MALIVIRISISKYYLCKRLVAPSFVLGGKNSMENHLSLASILCLILLMSGIYSPAGPVKEMFELQAF